MSGERLSGYVLITYTQSEGVAPLVLFNPWDKSQRLRAGLSNFPSQERIEGLTAFTVRSNWQLRRYTLAELLKMATEGDKDAEVLPVSYADLVCRGLRPMDRVEYEVDAGIARIRSVEGRTNPNDSLGRLHYANIREEKEDPTHREPIERLEEILKNPPSGIPQPLLKVIRDQSVAIARMLSFYSPFVRGGATLITGPAKAGKSTILRMLLAYLRWFLLERDKKVRIIVLAARERPHEFGIYQKMCRGTDGMEIFGTTREDNPPEKTYYTAYCALERAYRLIEGGADVFIFIDSLLRLAEALSLMATDKQARITSGHTPQAIWEPDAFFGAMGVAMNGASCTVIATSFEGRELPPWLRFPTLIWKGSVTQDIPVTERAAAYPKLNLVGDELSTRGWEYLDWSEEEKAFARELHEKVDMQGSPEAKLAYLVNTFRDMNPREVMAVWAREKIRNRLAQVFGFPSAATYVLVEKWGLNFEQVQHLAELGIKEANVIVALDKAEVTSQKILDLLEGRISTEEVLEAITEWSSDSYLNAVNDGVQEEDRREKALSPYVRNILIRAGVRASDVKTLRAQGKGYDFSAIMVAAKKIVEALDKGEKPADITVFLEEGGEK